MHFLTTTHSLNGHKNDNDEEDDVEKKEGQLWKSVTDWCVRHAERHGVVGDW